MSVRGRLLDAARVTSQVSQLLARITGLLIIALMLGVVVDSLLRGFFGIAIWGVLEFSTLMLLALVFLGLPSTQAQRVNFRVAFVTERLPAVANRALGAVLIALQLAVLGILCWFSWRSALYSFQRHEVSMSVLPLPLWPHRALVSLGLTLLWWQSLMSAVELVLEGKHPYAVDLHAEIEDAIGRQVL